MTPNARLAWLTGRRAARQWMSTRTVVALPLLSLIHISEPTRPY